jgi:uncharacterized membrane protein
MTFVDDDQNLGVVWVSIFFFFVLVDLPVLFLIFRKTWTKMIRKIENNTQDADGLQTIHDKESWFSDGSKSKNALAFVLAYSTMTTLMLFFVPKVDTQLETVLWAALMGFLVYGVFDGTNLFLFSKYSLRVGFVDMLWGGMLYGIVALIVSSIFVTYN